MATMRKMRWATILVTSILLASACGEAPPPQPPRTKRSAASKAAANARAIREVVELDAEAARARDTDPQRIPLADAVRGYVESLDSLELSRCPADFQFALAAHRDAWEAVIPYLEDFSDLRGEMHALFDALRADSNPGAPEFEVHVGAIFETWEGVEASMRAHGVDPQN